MDTSVWILTIIRNHFYGVYRVSNINPDDELIQT